MVRRTYMTKGGERLSRPRSLLFNLAFAEGNCLNEFLHFSLTFCLRI